MKARGFGRIINVAFAHALVASPFKSAYVAAKHGILGLTKTVALKAAAHGVTCNANPRDGQGSGSVERSSFVTFLWRPAHRQVRIARGGRSHGGVPVQRCGGLDHR
jgi:short subunit dehydrogenase